MRASIAIAYSHIRNVPPFWDEQTAQANCASQSLSIRVSLPTHSRKHAKLNTNVYVAGEVANRKSVLLRNLVLNGQYCASNPLLQTNTNR
jgi:hypothetical protein